MLRGIYLVVLGCGCFALGYCIKQPGERVAIVSQPFRRLPDYRRATMPLVRQAVNESSAPQTSPTPDQYEQLCRQLERINLPVCLEAEKTVGKMTFELLFGKLCKVDPVSLAEFLDRTPDLPEKGGLCEPVAMNWGLTDPHSAYGWLLRHRALMRPEDFHACQRTLLCSLAGTDPAMVSTFLSSIDDNEIREQVLAALTDGWLRKDPTAAFSWLRTLAGAGDSDQIRECYCTIMNKYIQLDPLKAAEAIGEIKSSDLQMQLAPAAARKMAETDVSAAVTWLQSFGSLDVRNAGLEAIINSKMASSPSAAADLLFTEVDNSPAGLSVMNDVFKGLAATDLNLAVERFDQAPAAAQPAIAATITSAWISQNLTQALDWLNTQPAGSVHDSGAAVAARYLMGVDPGAAIQWASSLGDTEARAALLKELVNQASARDLPAVQQALSVADLSGSEVGLVRQQIADRMDNTSPELVFP